MAQISLLNPGHRVSPYLLRSLIERTEHVWATDITSIPMAKSFPYPMAVFDWATRQVLAWSLSKTLTVDFRLAALDEAITRHGVPEIFSSDCGAASLRRMRSLVCLSATAFVSAWRGAVCIRPWANRRSTMCTPGNRRPCEGVTLWI